MSTEEITWEIEQIKQLKDRYFRCLDEHRWDELRRVFTEDVQLIVDLDPRGENAYRVDGADNFIADVSTMLKEVSHVHHGHMPEITLEGERRARGIWAMFDHLVYADRVTDGYGHYREQYRRGPDGAWRIARLHLTRLRIETTPIVPPS